MNQDTVNSGGTPDHPQHPDPQATMPTEHHPPQRADFDSPTYGGVPDQVTPWEMISAMANTTMSLSRMITSRDNNNQPANPPQHGPDTTELQHIIQARDEHISELEDTGNFMRDEIRKLIDSKAELQKRAEGLAGFQQAIAQLEEKLETAITELDGIRNSVRDKMDMLKKFGEELAALEQNNCSVEGKVKSSRHRARKGREKRLNEL